MPKYCRNPKTNRLIRNPYPLPLLVSIPKGRRRNHVRPSSRTSLHISPIRDSIIMEGAGEQPAGAVRTMRDYMNPARTSQPPTIVLPTTTAANTFMVKPNHIGLLPHFFGKTNESPYDHTRAFEEIVTTLVSNAGQMESARLKLFPFSLRDKAKSWFNSLPNQSVRTWADLEREFI